MDITNANPADPRWAEEAATRGQSDMASQILLHQLQAKAREHALLLEFLVALTSPVRAPMLLVSVLVCVQIHVCTKGVYICII